MAANSQGNADFFIRWNTRRPRLHHCTSPSAVCFQRLSSVGALLGDLRRHLTASPICGLVIHTVSCPPFTSSRHIRALQLPSNLSTWATQRHLKINIFKMQVFFFLIITNIVLGTEPRTLGMLAKASVTKLHPQC